jgi:hypothetical protein
MKKDIGSRKQGIQQSKKGKDIPRTKTEERSRRLPTPQRLEE